MGHVSVVKGLAWALSLSADGYHMHRDVNKTYRICTYYIKIINVRVVNGLACALSLSGDEYHMNKDVSKTHRIRTYYINY